MAKDQDLLLNRFYNKSIALMGNSIRFVLLRLQILKGENKKSRLN
jgi:hypothetical protein